MAVHAMNPVDAAWYHMDGPANAAVVTALLLTRSPLDIAKARAVLAQRLATIDRFRRRVVECGLPLPTPHWEDMPDFDIDQHVHHVSLPAPGDAAALQRLLDDLASMPLPRELPLWQAHVVDGVGRGGALVMRYHHCIGDGMAMMNVARQLFDAAPGPRRASRVAAAAAPVCAAPSPSWVDQAFVVMQGAGMLVGELLKRDDPESPLKGGFGMRQHVAWSKPLKVEDVKAVGAPWGAKVNDVLVAALAGALRRYLQGRGVPVSRTTVRAMVPVNLRPAARAQDLGNEFGLVILDLPVAVNGALKRLSVTKTRMDALKRSAEAPAMQWLFNLFGRGPKPLQDAAQHLFGSKASLVLTNVIGPDKPLSFAGVPVDRMVFWVPHPGDELGMGASILSYRGEVSLALMADAKRVPDPQVIIDAFECEFGLMLRRLKQAQAKARATASLSAPSAPAGASRAARSA